LWNKFCYQKILLIVDILLWRVLEYVTNQLAWWSRSVLKNLFGNLVVYLIVLGGDGNLVVYLIVLGGDREYLDTLSWHIHAYINHLLSECLICDTCFFCKHNVYKHTEPDFW